MPDYIPPVQLPTGLAEEAARLAAQRGQIWGQAFAGMGQNIGQGLQQYHQMQMNKPLDPQQLADIQAGKIPSGLTRDQQLSVNALQSTLKERKAASEEMTNRILMGKQLGLVEVTPDMISANPELAKRGIIPGHYPQGFISTLMKPPSMSTFSALTPEETEALRAASQRKVNPIPISLIKARGPGAKVMAQAFIKDPNYNPAKSEIEFASAKAGAQAGARFEESGPAQMVARVANSAMEQLDSLQQASDAFPRSNVQAFNTPIMKLDEQTMPEAQAWKIALNSARMEYATALNRGNSPGLENISEAAKALPDTITMKQLPAAIKQLRIGLTNTVKGMTKRAAPAGEAPKTAAKQSDYSSLSDDELLKKLSQ